MLNVKQSYTRRSNIIYDENGIAILKFHQNFIDFYFKPYSSAIDYINQYIELNPKLVEKLVSGKQIELF